jgi:hypothetical protein
MLFSRTPLSATILIFNSEEDLYKYINQSRWKGVSWAADELKFIPGPA